MTATQKQTRTQTVPIERALPETTYHRPRCPRCGSVKLAVRRTISQGDDTILRYCTCEACGTHSKIILE